MANAQQQNVKICIFYRLNVENVLNNVTLNTPQRQNNKYTVYNIIYIIII